MSEINNHLSRRDFFRVVGLALASIAAGRSAPSIQKKFNPKTGNVGDSAGRSPHPWWVRTVDKPTAEIDWEHLKRFDARNAVIGQGFIKYVGQNEVARLRGVAAENEIMRLLKGTPGYTIKDQALKAAQRFALTGHRSFLGPQVTKTPEERGVEKWVGTPEDAARILRIAMRHFGAATIGFLELDKRTRELIYSHDPDGKQIDFDDVDLAYETEEKRVIPNNAKWIIVYTVQMSTETIKRAPTITASQNTTLAYGRGLEIQNKTQEFLRGLGYQCLGEATLNGLGPSVGFAVLAGLGELSRTNRLITPEFGPMVRVFKMITDLPLATDKPIDAGIMEFCKQCKKCAEACPAGALSLEDEPTWEVRGGWNNPGHKAYFEDSVKCYTYWQEVAGSNCGVCFSVCPFSKKNKAWLHSWVKASIALSPILNGFFRSMDDAFSYGAQKDPETWWHLNLPEFGINTEQTIQQD
jgi:reductive dehalogenase